MFYNHILIEAYCTKDVDSEDAVECELGFNKININCFVPICPHLGITPCQNEISITDSDGIAAHWIGFGGDMSSDDETQRKKDLARWEKLCISKINEAYEIYMKG